MKGDLSYIHYSGPFLPMEGVFRAFSARWVELSDIPVFRGGLGEAVGAVRTPDCRAWITMLSSSSIRDFAAKLSIPVLNYSNRIGAAASAINVFSDEQEIGSLAAEALLSAAHRNFVMLKFGDACFSEERAQGFVKRLARAGIEPKIFTLNDPKNYNPAQFVLQRRRFSANIFAGIELPAAIFCASDLLAGMILEEAEAQLGEKAWLLSVAGVDNSFVDQSGPQLSSVQPNHEGMGVLMAEKLAAALASGTWERGSVARVGGACWVERESTWGGPGGRNPLVARCVRLIHKYLATGNSPQVATLADALGCNRRTLLTRFRECTGKTLRDYLISERLRYAAKLLRETDKTVAEIAFATGFSRQSNLSQSFRQVYGHTPREYRRSVRDSAR
jgi:AraC-like DNA-binding protein